jgi:hypothetical protein
MREVKLPPLPEPDVTSHIMDATMRFHEVRTYSGPQCVKHARAAVLADRAESERVLRVALDALIWEVGSEPVLYSTQTSAAIAAICAHLGEMP